MLAARTAPGEVGADGGRGARYPGALASGEGDPVAAAERWARAELPLRLRCFENWLTEHIRRRERDGTFLTELRPATYLSAGDAFLNIRELFGLLDEVREPEQHARRAVEPGPGTGGSFQATRARTRAP